MIKEKVRATRSDKKIDCKPTIAIELKDCIYRIAFIINVPIKNLGVEICRYGLHSKKVMDYLSNYFRRNFTYKNSVYIGHYDNKSPQKRAKKGETGRISIRFTQKEYELICALAYALDVTPSRATALLLETTIHRTDFINQVSRKFIKDKLSPSQLKEFKKVIRYINQNNPYHEEISWASLLSYIYDEVMISTNNIAKTLGRWIEKVK